MKYIDITKTITNKMRRYHSDPDIEISRFKSLKKGNSCNLLRLSFGTHTGTHIDAPGHIFDDGAGVDSIKISDLICKVAVVDFKGLSKKEFLERMQQLDVKGILFKSGGNKGHLDQKEADELAGKGIRLVGTEGMSIEDNANKLHPVHSFLLSRNILILEGLDLKMAKTGIYKLICLPLKIKDGDGAPVRAILINDKSCYF